ncbi:DUF1573 domain-containing protein [Engelhardtia mirabilis]|uniref:DUF1573 domain-containing protein n=1 Tax=Engelhardtia mirabilis TaxID=2528011 RepID=A0A518BJ77_9BACT|nr:hypothetical protein Pla133_20800 [Planctomycetes bacterium Pla133]QDV01330.1 hypothetical protein Pla86_20800 [Planctomycetes bacterium Pla86]
MQRLDRSAALAALLTAGLAGACANPSDASENVLEVNASGSALAAAGSGVFTISPTGERHSPWSPPVLETGVDLSGVRLPVGAAPAPAPVTGPPAVGPQPAPGAAANPGAPASTAVFNGPDGALTIEEGGDSHDFGPLVQGAVVEHTFTLRSTGESPLIVQSTKQSCGCTVATSQRVSASGEKEPYVFGGEIAPGESLEITARVNTEGKKNQLHSTVTVFSNDPARTHQLSLSADVQPFFNFEPNAYIQFGRLFANETRTEQVRVTSGVVDHFGLSLATEGIPEHLSIELRPVDPDADGRAAAWDVLATILPGAPESPSQNFPLRLVSDVPVEGAPAMPDGSARTQSAICYTVAQVVGLVSANPYYVSFGLVRPGQELERSFTIEIADDEFVAGEMPVTLRGRQPQDEELLADRLTWSVVPVDGDPHKYEVRLTLADLPDSYTGPFGGYVDVEIGHPTKPTLSIPFSGVVRTNVVRPQAPPATPIPGTSGPGTSATGTSATGSGSSTTSGN